jgi:hypothetical protein
LAFLFFQIHFFRRLPWCPLAATFESADIFFVGSGRDERGGDGGNLLAGSENGMDDPRRWYRISSVGKSSFPYSEGRQPDEDATRPAVPFIVMQVLGGKMMACGQGLASRWKGCRTGK